MKHIVACIAVMASAALASAFACAQSGCPGDLTGDGKVDGVDLALVLTNWGTCSSGSSITGVYPPAASTEGGTAVAIVGINLGATASISIDGLAVTNFQVVSPTTVTFTAPPAALGTKTIVLRNASSQVLASVPYFYFATRLPWAEVIEQSPDPAVVIDASLRNAIIATGLPWRVRDRGTGVEMLLVPLGIFQMGCIQPSLNFACTQDELPVHTVTLTSPYYLGRFELTQSQWSAAMGSNPSGFQGPAWPSSANRPVEQVSWNMVQGFLTATSLRLPTEAEWERACRAGTTAAFHSAPGFPNGSNDDGVALLIAWHGGWGGGNTGLETHPVGLLDANALGFHDMTGNVSEMVKDSWGPYSADPQTDPVREDGGAIRTVRGGTYGNNSGGVRSAFRHPLGAPWDSGNSMGFRVARNP